MGSESVIDSHVYVRLTGRGRGAIATILIHGSRLDQHLDALFRPKSGLHYSSTINQSMIYGNWIASDRRGEDVVICPLDENSVEIHCHGGEAAVAAIFDTLESRKFRKASLSEIVGLLEPTQWRMDFRCAMAEAKTGRSAEMLLGQYNTIDLRIRELENRIRIDADGAHEQLGQILDRALFGRHLVQPWIVVLCGEPNVGKSSLINALVGFERAIVHESSGTTRDVVSETTSLNGWPVLLTDTAGLRVAADSIEEMGISKARRAIGDADLIIQVTDASDGSNFPSRFVQKDKSTIQVRNKIDLMDGPPGSEKQDPVLYTSATSGAGITQLIDKIESQLVPIVPDRNDLVPITTMQARCYGSVRQLIEQNKLDAATQYLLDRRVLQD